LLGRIIKTLANEFLRNRHARTGTGPRRLPPTSINEAKHRAAHSIIRSIMNRFMRR
jgi:hypothetical protein